MSKTLARCRCLIVFVALLTLLSAAAAASAQTPATLEERMSEAEFKAYGLDKLSVEELRGLNRWLRGNAVTTGSSARADASESSTDERVGFRERLSDRTEIKARLPGKFTGWSGSTIFKLDNGQQWQQSESGTQSSLNLENAEITIKPKMMGNWLLVVDYCQCRIGVTRIK
ncbi:MAG: hypothetical protein ABI650_07540 [Dokdonella sp.]